MSGVLSTSCVPPETDVGVSMRDYLKGSSPRPIVVVVCRGTEARAILDACLWFNVQIILIVAPEEAKYPTLGGVRSIALKASQGFTNPFDDVQQIVSIAKSMGACCVHPGTGPLSHNVEFLRLLCAEGIPCITTDERHRNQHHNNVFEVNRALETSRPHKRGWFSQGEKNIRIRRRYGKHVDLLKADFQFVFTLHHFTRYLMQYMAVSRFLPTNMAAVMEHLDRWVSNADECRAEAERKATKVAQQYNLDARLMPLIGSIYLFMGRDGDDSFSIRARMDSWIRFGSVNMNNCAAFASALYTAIKLLPSVLPRCALEPNKDGWVVYYRAAVCRADQIAKLVGQRCHCPHFCTGTTNLRVLVDHLEYSEHVLMDPVTDKPSNAVDYANVVILEVSMLPGCGVKLQPFEDGNKKAAHVLMEPATFDVTQVDSRSGRTVVKLQQFVPPSMIDAAQGVAMVQTDNAQLIASQIAFQQAVARILAETARLANG